MSNYQVFMDGLDPKTAKRSKTASELEIVRYPLASRRITYALGGGMAAGRIHTIYGPSSAGKSLLSMQSVGMLQKQGLVCGLVDAEGTYDKDFGKKLGVNNDELLVTTAKPFQRAQEDFLPWINGGLDVLVIDTISDLIPEDFLDDKNNHFVPEKAKKMMAHAKSTANMIRAIMMENEKCAVLFLSQVTLNVTPTYTEMVPHGGKRVEHDSSWWLRLNSSPADGQQIKGEMQFGSRITETPVGRKVDWLVRKNKLGRSHATGKYNMYYAEGKIGDRMTNVGIDRNQELISMCGDFGVMDDQSSQGYVIYRDKKWREKALVTALENEAGFEDEVVAELELAMSGGVVSEQIDGVSSEAVGASAE